MFKRDSLSSAIRRTNTRTEQLSLFLKVEFNISRHTQRSENVPTPNQKDSERALRRGYHHADPHRKKPNTPNKRRANKQAVTANRTSSSYECASHIHTSLSLWRPGWKPTGHSAELARLPKRKTASSMPFNDTQPEELGAKL